MYHPRQVHGTTLDYRQTLDWLLSDREMLVTLLAWDRLYGTGPDRDDLRAQYVAAMGLNHARSIAQEKLPAELQATDLTYLRAKAPDPREQEREAMERARRRASRQ